MNYAAFDKDTVLKLKGRGTITTDVLTQLRVMEAQQMLQMAIEAKIQDFTLEF